ncbi:MAG: hypothetical protein MUP14_03430 [Dehalococcoidia bacterium]|nr:hypothetical protein [Dehalococcoidia bacterium]
MKRWLLLALIPIGLLLLAAGALLLQSAGQAEAKIVSGDSLSCSASGGSGDALVVGPDSAGTSLETTDTAALSAQCYFVGISILADGCVGPNPWDFNQDLWIMRYLCYRPDRGWYYSNYGYCYGCEREGDSVSDYRYWEVCTWWCEGEWVEWELSAVGDLCTYGWSDSEVRLSWLGHGLTWRHYYSGGGHRVRLAPQWGTKVEYGPFWDRETEYLGGCSPDPGGCWGHTTESICTGPGITDDWTSDACGDVDEWFVDPEFNTYGYIWCIPGAGVDCKTDWVRLDVDWSG